MVYVDIVYLTDVMIRRTYSMPKYSLICKFHAIIHKLLAATASMYVCIHIVKMSLIITFATSNSELHSHTLFMGEIINMIVVVCLVENKMLRKLLHYTCTLWVRVVTKATWRSFLQVGQDFVMNDNSQHHNTPYKVGE